MRERYLLGLTAVPFVVAALLPGRCCLAVGRRRGHPVRGPRDRRVQRPGGRRRTVGHHQRLRRHRPRLHRRPRDRRRPSASRSGRPTRSTSRRWRRRATARSGSATSATTGPSARRSRSSRVPVGRGDTDVDAPSYELVFPEGPRDAESLLADPATGRLYVVSKGVFGGAVYAAPGRLSAGPAQPARPRSARCWGSRPTRRSSPTGGTSSCATTPRRPSTPGPTSRRWAASGCRDQQQGEGIAVGRRTARSTRRRRACTRPVLRIALPAAVRRAMEPPSPARPRRRAHADRDAAARLPARAPSSPSRRPASGRRGAGRSAAYSGSASWSCSSAPCAHGRHGGRRRSR